MNAEQYRRHFELMQDDDIIRKLRNRITQLTERKDSRKKAALRLQIYSRSEELKDKAIAEFNDSRERYPIDMRSFSAAIDAFLAKKES